MKVLQLLPLALLCPALLFACDSELECDVDDPPAECDVTCPETIPTGAGCDIEAQTCSACGTYVCDGGTWKEQTPCTNTVTGTGTDTGSATDTATATNTDTGTGSGTGTGTGGMFACVPIGSLMVDGMACPMPDQAACSCLGCNAECVDSNGTKVSDCSCPVCNDNGLCGVPLGCVNDGGCNPLNEGCGCFDCAGHPACL